MPNRTASSGWPKSKPLVIIHKPYYIVLNPANGIILIKSQRNISWHLLFNAWANFWRQLLCVTRNAALKVKGKDITFIYRHKRQLQLQRRCTSQTERANSPVGWACAHRLWPTMNSHTQPWSAVYGIHPYNPCNYMDYYSFTDPNMMEGWVGLVGWPIADTLSTKWSHVNHKSAVDQGKSVNQRPTF